MEEEEKKDFSQTIAKFLPAIEKPTYKQSFNKRLMWTGVVLVAYIILSHVSIYGVKQASFEQFRFYEIITGSKFGSVMTLGIGPIVTAGILLQLLVGSKIINWDTTKPEGRMKFQVWDKFLAILLCFIEGVIYVGAGALQVEAGMLTIILVSLQLAAGGIIVILLDEIVSKWGFSSGISLFIAVGVGSTLFIRVLSPFVDPSQPSMPTGLVWKFFLDILANNSYAAFASLMPMLFTAIVFVIVVYMQNIRIEIPLSFASMRGFGRTWDLKFFYTSNIPVILAAALIANFQLMGHMGATQTAEGLCSMFACYDANGNLVSGLFYYLTSPRNLVGDLIAGTLTSPETIRAATYLTFMSAACMIFSIFWVSTSGMDSGTVAEQIESTGMYIPGYRSDKKTMQTILEKYIPPLALLGGLTVGLLASFADFTGAIGTGTGILLTVMIVYNVYEELSRQNLDEAHPLVRKFLE